jgi:hypothetical protein
MPSMKSEYFVHIIIVVLLVIIIAMLLMQGQKKESFDMENFRNYSKKLGDTCKKGSLQCKFGLFCNDGICKATAL